MRLRYSQFGVRYLVFLTFLVSCSSYNLDTTSPAKTYQWPQVLLQAQEEARKVDVDAVVDAVRAAPLENDTSGVFLFYFVFLRPSGEEITVKAYQPPLFQVEVSPTGQSVQLQQQEVDIRRDVLEQVALGPVEALEKGRALRATIEASGSLTLPVSPTLKVGLSVQQDYGVSAVWMYDIVSSTKIGFIVIDAVSGRILREDSRTR